MTTPAAIPTASRGPSKAKAPLAVMYLKAYPFKRVIMMDLFEFVIFKVLAENALCHNWNEKATGAFRTRKISIGRICAFFH